MKLLRMIASSFARVMVVLYVLLLGTEQVNLVERVTIGF